MNPPSLRPSTGDDGRKRLILHATVVLLVVIAVLILLLPIRLPRPLRLAVAFSDLFAAALIWFLGRQRYGKWR